MSANPTTEASCHKEGWGADHPRNDISSLSWHSIAGRSVLVGCAFALRTALHASSTLILRIWAGELNATSA